MEVAIKIFINEQTYEVILHTNPFGVRIIHFPVLLFQIHAILNLDNISQTVEGL